MVARAEFRIFPPVMLDIAIIRRGIAIDFGKRGTINVVVDLPEEHFLPQFLKVFLGIRLAELRGEQGEFLRVHQQHFAPAIVALHLRVGGEGPAMGLDVEFIVHHGEILALRERLDFMEVIQRLC